MKNWKSACVIINFRSLCGKHIPVMVTIGLIILLTAPPTRADVYSADTINRLFKQATPSQLSTFHNFPRGTNIPLRPAEIQVPPSRNPSGQDLRALQQFMSHQIKNGGEQSQPQQLTFPEQYVETYIPGVGYGQAGVGGIVRARNADGTFLYTDGHQLEEEPGAHASSTSSASSVASSGDVLLPADAELEPLCTDTGRRFQVVIATKPNYAVTWQDVEDVFQSVLRANGKIIWESLRSSNFTRLAQLKVKCYNSGPFAGLPELFFIQVPDLDFVTYIYPYVRNQFGNPQGQDAKRYIVFGKRDTPSGGGLSSSPGLWSSAYDQKDLASFNMWNNSTEVAAIYASNWLTHTVVHEILHTVGAVNYESGALFSTAGGHCYAGYAVLCYKDNGPYANNYPSVVCPDTSPMGYTVDCLYWSHFRTQHQWNPLFPPVEYLQYRRNTAGAENRFFRYAPEWDYDGRCGLASTC